MKRKILYGSLLGLFAMTLTSCYNSRVYVGSISKEEPLVKVQKQRNDHFIYGLVDSKNAKMSAKDIMQGRQSYMIKTHTTFVNGLVRCLTGGIYTPTTTTFYVPLSTVEK